MLVVLTTHPIQYQIPIWSLIAKRGNIPFEVWYLTTHGVQPTFDTEFGKTFKWDIGLLDGYPYRFPDEPTSEISDTFKGIRLPKDFKERLKNSNISALFITGWHFLAFWEATFLAHKHNIPVWLRGDSHDLKKDFWLKHSIKKIILGSFFQRIDCFLYVGEANKRLFLSYDIPEKKMLPALHAVDNSRFVKQAEKLRCDRDLLREKWNISKDAFCILFVGKFTEIKRPYDVISAINILQKIDSQTNYQGIMVGTGKLAKFLKAECNTLYDTELGKQEPTIQNSNQPKANISFTGFLNQTELSKAYIVADALVLPSTSETWGLVVNEALSSGLPCIVSETCGSAEDLVKPIDKKLCFPAGDQKALAQAIKHLSENYPDVKKINKTMKEYKFTCTVKSLEKLWHSILC